MKDITLSLQAIKANIGYYESLVQEHYDILTKHVIELDYWLTKLDEHESNEQTKTI